MQSLPILVLGLFSYLLLVSADLKSDRPDSPLSLREGVNKREHAKSLRGSLVRRDLAKRSGLVTYDTSCDTAPPKHSGFKPKNGFPTKKSVLEKAYEDALKLASTSASIGNTNLAFTHYFGGNLPDVQYTHYTAMMSSISAATQYFSIQFECSGKLKECTEGKSAAVTDATAGGPNDQKTISICDRFWTSQKTKFLLYDADKGEDPGVPYRDNTHSGWCDKDKNRNSKKSCNWFQTAGHSILHELTHLDSLAKQAGLKPPPNGDRHGTDDEQNGLELTGARDYLKEYEKDADKASPDYNAESYAAAATEFYFMGLCDFKEIKPLVPQEKSLDVSFAVDAANASIAANTSTTSSYSSLATPIPSGAPSGYFNGTSR